MSNFADLAAKHGGNILKTGAYMVASSIISASLRNSTTQSLEEIAKDIRRARNNFKERKGQTN